MCLCTKDGRALQVSGDKVYSRSGTIVGEIKGDKVYATDGHFVGLIVDRANVGSSFSTAVLRIMQRSQSM